MSLSDLASLGSFISGVAVVFSFVFLALQIRQSNLNQRALMQQGRAARTADLLSKAADPHLSELIVRSGKMDLTLKSAEVQSLVRTYASWILHYEDSFLQFQAGTLDRASWESDLASLKYIATVAGYRVAWRFLKDMGGSPAYMKYVDSLFREAKIVEEPDFAEHWQIWMAEERAAI